MLPAGRDHRGSQICGSRAQKGECSNNCGTEQQNLTTSKHPASSTVSAMPVVRSSTFTPAGNYSPAESDSAIRVILQLSKRSVSVREHLTACTCASPSVQFLVTQSSLCAAKYSKGERWTSLGSYAPEGFYSAASSVTLLEFRVILCGKSRGASYGRWH